MKSLILLIVFFTSFIYSYELKLTNKDIEKINNSPKKSFILNRFTLYEKLKDDVADYELIKKLTHVNSFMNRILPKFDLKEGIAMDYWATPKEFLIEGHGDCEDYAIAKYFTLLELGIPKEKLYFAVVKVRNQREDHMVLLYIENKNSSPLVLDNLSFRVIPFSKRPTLTPKFAFNEIDAYLFSKDKFAQKVKINWGEENKWENLLYRVYNLKE